MKKYYEICENEPLGQIILNSAKTRVLTVLFCKHVCFLTSAVYFTKTEGNAVTTVI